METMAFHWLGHCQERTGVSLPVGLLVSLQGKACELLFLVFQPYLTKVSVFFFFNTVQQPSRLSYCSFNNSKLSPVSRG